MSCASDYLIVKSKDDIYWACSDFAMVNVDRMENLSGDYHNRHTIVEDVICDSYDDAIKYIDKATGYQSYVDMSVRFREIRELKSTKEMQRIYDRIKEATKVYHEAQQTIYAKTIKAKLLTCKRCESKLNTKFIRTNTCSVCYADLRPDYLLEKEKGYKDKISKLQEKLKELRLKQKDKAPIKWCVKVSVHC